MFFASFHDQSLIVDFDDCDILLSELNKETNPLLVFMFLPFFPISITIFCTTSKLEKNPISSFFSGYVHFRWLRNFLLRINKPAS